MSPLSTGYWGGGVNSAAIVLAYRYVKIPGLAKEVIMVKN
jgi:hypothetical protein